MPHPARTQNANIPLKVSCYGWWAVCNQQGVFQWAGTIWSRNVHLGRRVVWTVIQGMIFKWMPLADHFKNSLEFYCRQIWKFTSCLYFSLRLSPVGWSYYLDGCCVVDFFFVFCFCSCPYFRCHSCTLKSQHEIYYFPRKTEWLLVMTNVSHSNAPERLVNNNIFMLWSMYLQ